MCFGSCFYCYLSLALLLFYYLIHWVVHSYFVFIVLPGSWELLFGFQVLGKCLWTLNICLVFELHLFFFLHLLCVSWSSRVLMCTFSYLSLKLSPAFSFLLLLSLWCLALVVLIVCSPALPDLQSSFLYSSPSCVHGHGVCWAVCFLFALWVSIFRLFRSFAVQSKTLMWKNICLLPNFFICCCIFVRLTVTVGNADVFMKQTQNTDTGEMNWCVNKKRYEKQKNKSRRKKAETKLKPKLRKTMTNFKNEDIGHEHGTEQEHANITRKSLNMNLSSRKKLRDLTRLDMKTTEDPTKNRRGLKYTEG